MRSHQSEDHQDEPESDAEAEGKAYDHLIEDLFMTLPEDAPKEE